MHAFMYIELSFIGGATHIAVQSGRNAVCIATCDEDAAEIIASLSSLQ